MTKIINLYGGPGCGKSTTAAGIFYHLKNKGYKIEFVTEYAKDLVWEDRVSDLEIQIYIFAKQYRKMLTVASHKVDYIVTDSPLLLSAVYGHNDSDNFKSLVFEKYKEFDNIDFMLSRAKPYALFGRTQTEKQAVELDERIQDYLKLKKVPFIPIIADYHGAQAIVNHIERMPK